MSRYGQVTNKTPQSQKVDPRQIKNDAGGYTFDGGDWLTLDRFLIMGVVGNTFYANRNEIVINNITSLVSCIREDGIRYVDRIVEIASQGRAVKQDTLTFALALAQKHGDLRTRRYAYEKVPIVCSTFYSLANMLNDRKDLNLGWSSGLRSAVCLWYNTKGLEYLIYQALKYPYRNGWEQRNVVRLSHISSLDPARQLVYDWICARVTETRPGKKSKAELARELYEVYGYKMAYSKEMLFAEPTVENAVEVIDKERFTREMIPTNLLTDARVWKSLVNEMPFMATVRNLNKLSQLGIIDPVSGNDIVVKRLTNKTATQLSRIHPVNLLIANKVYSSGAGVKGSMSWTPSSRIISSLEQAFLNAMDSWPKTNTRLLIGVDISQSMRNSVISESIPFTPSEMAGAIACTMAHIEPNCLVMGFTLQFEKLAIYANTSISEAMKEAGSHTTKMGATDCAMPMMYALGYDSNQTITRGRIEVGDYIKTKREPINVDAFVILTDNETWIGKIHPHVALEMYRARVNKDAKLVVVTMQPSRWSITIADPADKNSLDIVGFDSSVPQLIQDFVTGGV